MSAQNSLQTQAQADGTPWLSGGAPGAPVARALVRSHADIRAIEQVPIDHLFTSRTILQAIESSKKADPDKAAILQLLSSDPDAAPRRLTYAELTRAVIQSANLFHKLASPEKPSVVVIAPFLPEALIATWAGATAGCVTPINPALDNVQLASIMNAVHANILVVADRSYGSAAWSRLSEFASSVRTLKHVLTIDSHRSDDFLSSLEDMPGASLSFDENVSPDAVNIYIPTGGTTGAPKLVKLTTRGQLLNAWLFGSLSVASSDEVVGHAMPNFHVGGLIAISLRAMLYGQTLLTLTPLGFRDPGVIRNFWNIARKYGMTNVIMAPTTVASLLDQAEGTSKGHCFKSFICGGSTIPVELLNEFYEKTGIYLKETWGMTEFQGPCSGHLTGQARPVAGSVGIAYPHHHVRVAKLSDNRFIEELPAGERGVLIVSGPTVTPGYLDETLSTDLFVLGGPDGQRWASTGDLGAVDSDGFIWVYGREKDVIIRAGNNIDPKVIEEALQLHPSVLISGAVGRPDALKGELPMAYVQLKEGASAEPDELIEFCRDRMERGAIPVEVVLIPAMPLTAMGKISKPTLRVDAMKRVVRELLVKVVPDGDRIPLKVDDAGKRPAMVVLLEPESFRDAALVQKLQECFSRFAFKSEIRELSAQ
ncbi:fatty-acyl-CoA synthase [Bradyrhizobium macuxiense]|uniref:Fatty-acyl-CoA synthase n=1 Tax=Bradyrhizobium macuxiense TaxID=1755647 RepID=A0A560L3G9_9BRAD|nr:AMP-binding protein [Bradyrhizobium macuxiense]TWB88984.1 fatty-acyl-CoA synthase [Bradyrhizobium macuxiense]